MTPPDKVPTIENVPPFFRFLPRETEFLRNCNFARQQTQVRNHERSQKTPSMKKIYDAFKKCLEDVFKLTAIEKLKLFQASETGHGIVQFDVSTKEAELFGQVETVTTLNGQQLAKDRRAIDPSYSESWSGGYTIGDSPFRNFIASDINSPRIELTGAGGALSKILNDRFLAAQFHEFVVHADHHPMRFNHFRRRDKVAQGLLQGRNRVDRPVGCGQQIR